MVKLSLLTVLPVVAAWPGVMEMDAQVQKRVEPGPRAPLFESNKPNTGVPTTIFNAEEQFVDVRDTSEHPWKAPGAGDLRGQCPGLNAVANHGFFPRNGKVTIAQTIDGLFKAYGMGPDMALFLSVVSVALAGDPLTGTWSIGGSFPATIPLIGGHPSGIVGTHNQYEGDASIVRGDAYLNDGKVGVFQMRSWEHLWENAEGGLTFDKVAVQSDYVTRWSKANNPYFFQAPFSGLVAPAAHHFVIHFMSNHSAEVPTGTLSREILKSFFSVTGDSPGNFVHNRGLERIPDNWYRRPGSLPHVLPSILTDLLTTNGQFPGVVGFGGNTGTVNSYAGVDLSDITGGVFNLQELAEGNNGACFLLQAATAGLPDATDAALGAVGSILGWATQQLGPLTSKFTCPQLASFNSSLFDKFPGAEYQAKGLRF